MSDPISALPVARDSDSPEIVWRPTPFYVERSRLRRLIVRERLASLAELITRAAAEPAWFWDAVVKDLELEWFEPYSQVLDRSQGVEWPRWFIGGRYNYVHDAVDKHALRLRPTATAILWEGEDSASLALSYAELYAEVCRAAHALFALGIGKGDRVGVFLPMLPETAIAMLAIAKIGAVCCPVFSGFGAGAVATRLSDSGAKLLITADGFYRAGKQVSMKATADEAAAASPTIEHMLVVRRLGHPVPWRAGRDVWWHDIVAAQNPTCATEQTGAEDPFLIIYTSGTTGRPKGVIHVHSGFPIKAAQELAHCFDLHAGERLFWLSDIGWMMGPWAIAGALMLGATCFLYEGSISYPQPDRIWAMVERHHITHLGLAPTAVRALMAEGDRWVLDHDRSSLIVLAGAGEPWNPAPWRWLFEVAGEGRRPLINYSGGTECSGGILSSNPLLPLKPCAFSAPVPGMAPDIVDESGRSVRGSVGELVLREPWPGIARGFWQAPQRYLETYWSRLPGVWVHGDWALVDDDGFWYILGRADDTINVAGKRVGPAELESAALAHPAVVEAAAIGVPDQLKGEVPVVFVVLRDGSPGTAQLRDEIAEVIAAQLGRALRPGIIKFVKDFPRTRNGKILRRLIRRRYLGEPLGDLSALENPPALDAITDAM
ncbi:MAG: acetyl-CoA synthetase [Herpetosiphonaceae bacterium]|nr:MAG: acetyl-CoA synthetase [Herpetosiphonaceae bacterium]